jgi:hypothetical protein
MFTNFSIQDGIFFVVMIGLGYLAYTVTPLGVLPVIIVTIVLFIRFPRGVGRLYREVWLEFRGNYIEGILGGVLWQADESGREKRFAKYLRSRMSALPIELTQIKAVIDGKLEQFGMLQQLDRPYDHLFILSSGGNFANMGNAAESKGVNLLASVTNSSILLNTDMKVGSSFLRITTPSNPSKLTGTLRRKIDPMISFPEKFELTEADKEYVAWQRANIEQWQPVISAMSGTSNWQLIVLTIKRSWATRIRWRVKSATNRQLTNLPIIELGRTLVQDLSSATSLGLKDVHVAGLAELAEIFHVSWNAFGTDQYFKDKSQGLVPATDEDIDSFREAHKGDKNLPKLLDGFLRAFPQRIVKVHRKKKCVQFDENYISVIRITRFPESIRADQFRELQYRLSRHGWIRRAMVAESVSSDKETRQQLIGQSALINVNNAMNKGKIVQDPRRARSIRRKQEQTNVISAQSIAQLFNYLWTVVCVDLDDVEKAHREIIGILRSAGFKAKVVGQPALLVDAAISGLLGANRL